MVWGASAAAACPPGPVVRVDIATPGMTAEQANEKVLEPLLRPLQHLAGVGILNGSAGDRSVTIEVGFARPATGAELALVRAELERLRWRLPVTAQTIDATLQHPKEDPDCHAKHDR
jgi:multidrug efflux pump subunit AcrB